MKIAIFFHVYQFFDHVELNKRRRKERKQLSRTKAILKDDRP